MSDERLREALDAVMTAVHELHGELGPDHDTPWHNHEAAWRAAEAALAAQPEGARETVQSHAARYGIPLPDGLNVCSNLPNATGPSQSEETP